MRTFAIASMAALASAQEFSSQDLSDLLNIVQLVTEINGGDGPDIKGLTTVQYNEMLAGLMYGVIEQNDLTEIEACLCDGKEDAIDAYNAFILLL